LKVVAVSCSSSNNMYKRNFFQKKLVAKDSGEKEHRKCKVYISVSSESKDDNQPHGVCTVAHYSESIYRESAVHT